MSTLLLAVNLANAQKFPAGPVKMITPMAAGSGTDQAMRFIADKLGELWSEQTVVVNQPGAGGAISARNAASAPPDGRTFFMAIASTYIVLPFSDPELHLNVNDFIPIGFVGEVPMGIAASPKIGVDSLSSLIALSKTRQGGLDVAVGFRGGIPDLTTELFRSRSGANLNSIYYPGSAQAMGDAISGRIQVLVDGLAGPIDNGELKLLAVASTTRLEAHPEIPTVSETVPDFTASGWFVLVAPPGTPASIATRVNHDLQEILGQPEVKREFAALSVSTRAMSPQDLSIFIRDQQTLWGPIAKKIAAR